MERNRDDPLASLALFGTPLPLSCLCKMLVTGAHSDIPLHELLFDMIPSYLNAVCYSLAQNFATIMSVAFHSYHVYPSHAYVAKRV